MKLKKIEVIQQIIDLYPDAECELNYQNHEQLAIAVILSAQTTDISVNKVTPILYTKFPSLEALAQGDVSDIEKCLHSIGLYRNKAKNIQAFASELITHHQGILPSDTQSLRSLAGIGQKTANVIQAVAFKIPALAVDTHVHRVSLRLGLVTSMSNVLQTEAQLKQFIPQELWIQAHHSMLFFGRYFCMAKKPRCLECPFQFDCKYNLKKIKTP